MSKVQAVGCAPEMQFFRQDDEVLEASEVHAQTISIASRNRKEFYWTPLPVLPQAEHDRRAYRKVSAEQLSRRAYTCPSNSQDHLSLWRTLWPPLCRGTASQ